MLSTSLFLTTYWPLCKPFLSYWACGPLEGTRYLYVDPIIECGGALHRAWRGIAISGLILWVALPPSFLAIIVLNRAVQHRLFDKEVIRVWGELYGGLSNGASLWGFIEMSKTLMFTSIALYWMESPAAQIAMLMLVILIYSMLQVAPAPSRAEPSRAAPPLA